MKTLSNFLAPIFEHLYCSLQAVIDHVEKTPQSLLVVEEYDKMDCQTRGLFKQLLDSSHSTNASMERCFPQHR